MVSCLAVAASPEVLDSLMLLRGKKKILELCAYAEISSFTNKTFLLDVGLLGTPYGCHKALFIDVD